MVHIAQSRHSEHRLGLLGHFKVLIDAASQNLGVRICDFQLQVRVLDLLVELLMVLEHLLFQFLNIVLIGLPDINEIGFEFDALVLDLFLLQFVTLKSGSQLSLVLLVHPS